MTQQTSLNGSASEKAIRLHEQAITGQQNIPIDIRRLYQAIVVNIYSGEGKLGTERSRQVQTGSFPP
jgi:hypothetical protein